jgi:hypothetical protein
MSKPIIIVIASSLALLGASSLAGATGSTSNKLTKVPSAVPVLGQPVNVPVGQFVQAFAYCPKGYYVTGGGTYNGAVTEIASSPTKDLRGWFLDGTNNDPMGRTFQHRAVAVCAKGNPTLSARTAAAASVRLVHQVEREYASRQGVAGHG